MIRATAHTSQPKKKTTTTTITATAAAAAAAKKRLEQWLMSFDIATCMIDIQIDARVNELSKSMLLLLLVLH